MKKTLPIILCIVIAVTFTTTDAFAVAFAGSNPPANAKATKPTKPAVKKPTLPKPTKVRAYSGFESVLLKWEAVPKAEEYIIYRTVAGKKKFKQVGKTNKTEFTDKINYIYNDYAYRIVATRHDAKDKKILIKSAPAKIRQNSVKRLRIYVTFKRNKKYDTGTIKAGTRISTDGFGAGNYYFQRKGKRHVVSRVSVGNAYAKYKKKGNYKKSDAELFISDLIRMRKLTPTKKYIIWVSSYTQHLYVFKQKKGKWKVVKDWEVSMGTAATPSPTGKKSIKKKVLKHHGIRYWNCYSTWNALHGVTGSMEASIGRLASHGCIRNENGNAAWLYAKCPKGTPVIIY